MAIIQYSGLVNRIKGRVSHSVVSNWKGRGIIKRHNGSPRQAHSQAQQETRGLMNDLAGEFHALDLVNKIMWQGYATLLPEPITALNAYVSHNLRIQKYLPGTARRTVPNPDPETPAAMLLTVLSAMPNGNFCVYWNQPDSADLIVVADYAVSPGKRTDANPKWTFGATCGADALEILVPSATPAGFLTYVRVKTINIYGKASPWGSTMSLVAIE
jgi:hypothetical protein